MSKENCQLEGQFQCGPLFCTGKFRRGCLIAKQIRHQAKHGSGHSEGSDVWPEENWQDYLKRSEVAKDHCAHPDQLQKAFETTPKRPQEEEVTEALKP